MPSLIRVLSATLMLVVIPSAVFRARAADAPCIAASTVCTSWVTLGGGPARSLVYTTRPLDTRSERVKRALVVIHGLGRNADNYFRSAVAAAFLDDALEDTIVIAPRFAANDGAGCKDALAADEINWTCTGRNWRAGGAAAGAEGPTSFDLVDEILRRLARKDVFPLLASIVVAGHSAGGQFVTRYQMANQVDGTLGVAVTYVVANPSAYPYLDNERPVAASGDYRPYADGVNCTTFDNWPYGLKDRRGYAAKIGDEQLRKQLLARPVTYLLGGLDTLPLAGFDASCPAVAQGPHRLGRGQAFAAYLKQRYATEQKVVVVTLCGHTARCMFTADPALPVLFPKPSPRTHARRVGPVGGGGGALQLNRRPAGDAQDGGVSSAGALSHPHRHPPRSHVRHSAIVLGSWRRSRRRLAFRWTACESRGKIKGMGLREYRRKRNFKATPEPAGKSPRAGRRRSTDLAFVIQKHAASHLHYDFRLELDGTLKSWAVPKGPSLDPADKRLAMQVEDHPLEYGGFEGTIPKGEYGGGTVMVWDRGTWEPLGDPHKGYRDGNLKFTLDGEKLHGGWALVRIRGRQRGDNNGRSWLLIKERDKAARSGNSARVVDTRPKSVSTGRTLDQIAAAKGRVWHSNRKGGKAAPAETRAPRARSARGRRSARGADPDEISGARKAGLPKFLPPELAILVDRAPAGESWLHEMKYDGYRILARVEHGSVRLLSRNGRDWTDNFPTIAKALEGLDAERAFLDGEVAVLLENGTTSFQALQNHLSGLHAGQLTYLVFDLLHLNGRDLTEARLEDRKRLLADLLGPVRDAAGPLRYSDHVVGDGPAFFAQACQHGLEGIVSKLRDAPYRSTRSREWLKVKCSKRQEVVIGGYTDPEGSRVGLGALLAGVYEKGRLVYAGKIGTGFTEKTLRELTSRLRALEREACPFAPQPAGVGRPHWVKPELVAEVSFSEWTEDGRMRHPSFLGLRKDKPATSVVRELPAPVEEVAPPRSESKTKRSAKSARRST